MPVLLLPRAGNAVNVPECQKLLGGKKIKVGRGKEAQAAEKLTRVSLAALQLLSIGQKETPKTFTHWTQDPRVSPVSNHVTGQKLDRGRQLSVSPTTKRMIALAAPTDAVIQVLAGRPVIQNGDDSVCWRTFLLPAKERGVLTRQGMRTGGGGRRRRIAKCPGNINTS